MNKRNLWWGIGAAVVVAAVIIFAVVHKSNKPATTSSGYGTPSTSSSTKSSTSSDIITTKTDPSLGSFLATSSGQPLYTYGSDTTGVSNCIGACLASWPIYGPVSSSASLPANITVITRSDGKAQYAYKGMPLYTFTGDSGSTPYGDGVSNFHIAKP